MIRDLSITAETVGCGLEFRPKAFLEISNASVPLKKPNGGLWSSPVGSEWSWTDWCRSEEFLSEDKLRQRFTFEFSGRCVVIDSVKDLSDLAWIEARVSPAFTNRGIDFQGMLACGIDAIWLTAEGEEVTRFSKPRDLYGWDCETVLVMNPKCIQTEIAA